MLRQNPLILTLLVLLVSITAELLAQSPQITNPTVRSRHWGSGGPQVAEGWSADAWATITDPQGLGDIDSVWVDGPNGFHIRLYDDGNHYDAGPNDGQFASWTDGLGSPPVLGVYSFRARDKSGNLVVAPDTLTAVLDYPRNITPNPGSVVTNSRFTIGWDRVLGANLYHVEVTKQSGGNPVWTVNLDANQTSVGYNFDNTGENLLDGLTYMLRVDANDANSNQGQRVDVRFVYSTNPVSPVLGRHQISTTHQGDDRGGGQSYSLFLEIQVADPQGLDDIASVIVTSPDGKTYPILYNNSDGDYDGWTSPSSVAPQIGVYRFRATDKSGNWTEALDTLTTVIDYPRNVKPVNGAVVNTATPTFSWDAVPGATRYQVGVNDASGNDVWESGSLKTLNVVYNSDGLAKAFLNNGSTYRLSINCGDARNNWGSNNGNSFTYSTNTSSPILSNAAALSGHTGNDPGTNSWYYLDLRIQVVDPQGPGDIASVVGTGPTGMNYPLTDDNGDGVYDARFGNSAPPNLGVYRIKVTDRSGNWAEALDTLRAVLDYPKNAKPANGDVVNTATPTFSWNAVPGATSYGIAISDAAGKRVWGTGSLKTLSAVFNSDGRAEAGLKDGSTYTWNIGASDDDGNWCNQDNRFTYSTNVASPILSSPSARAGHNGDESGNQSYMLSFGIQVADPQGLSDIASVRVTGPDGIVYPMLDNNNDGWYDAWLSGLSVPPQIGVYRFRATDKSGNWTEALDTIKAVLDYPRNVRPANAEVVLTSTPTFSWNAVPGATRYWVWVYDASGSRIWWRDDLKTASVVYNYDGRALADLKDGSSYTWNFGAADAHENWGEQNTRRFTYSTNPFSPIISDPHVRSRHWVGGDLSENWGLDSWANVTDPQGLTDIDSVWIDGPNSYHLKLFDDGGHSDGSANDGSYAHWTSGLNTPPTTGVYAFKARDKSGNLVSVSDTLVAVLDYPRNLVPQQNAIVSLPGFSISWDRVAGAAWYEAAVSSLDWSKTYWSSGRELTGTSVRYNEDGKGEPLADGGIYLLTIRTGDKNDNEAERVGVRIAYRINGRRIVYVDAANTSGIDRGTQQYPYNTIQEGIDASVSRDTVLVSPGRYVENVQFRGMNIVLSSFLLTTGDTSYVSRTIIDGNKKGVVVGFYNREDSTTVLNGFSIVNGYDPNYGGLRVANGASPQLTNLVIRNNVSGSMGGGITFDPGNSGNQKIKNVRIFDNSANLGGGLYFCCGAYNAYVENVVIRNNKANNSGGAVCAGQQANVFLTNVTIANNSSGESGIVIWDQASVTLQNSILWNNSPREILGNVKATYSDVKGGYSGTGNLNKDPLFVDDLAGDLRIQANSPSIDAGNPDTDGDGITWNNDPADRDPDGTRRDMGALYFDQRTLFPSAPQNLSAMPADRSVVLRWSPNPEFNVAYYRIYRSYIHGFTPASKDSIAAVLSPDTSYVDRNVTNGQMYYYRMSAVNVVANESPITEEANAMPGKISSPVLASPPNGATNQWTTLTLTWNPAVTASSYHLQVAVDTNFASLIVNDSTITGVNKEVSPLDFNTTYYWRVSAKNIAGTTAFSPYSKFTVIAAAPATVTLSSPTDQLTGVPVNPTLRWNSVTGAASYHIQVASKSSFSPSLVDTIVSSASYQPGALSNNTTYYWRIRWKNAQDYGSYSTVWSFTTMRAAPTTAVTPSSPANGAVQVVVSPTLSWSAVTNATTYHLQVSTTSSFATTVMDDSTLTGITKQIGPLLNNTLYYWRVRGMNDGGNGPYSATWSFTTIVLAPNAAAALSAPADKSQRVAVNPTLAWLQLSDASNYQLQVSTSQTFASRVFDDTTLTQTSQQLSSLQNSTTYYWRVRGKNAGGSGPYSLTWSFTTIIALPEAITLSSPQTNATSVPVSQTLKWVASSVASQYHVQLSTSSAFTTTVLEDTSVTTTAKQVGPLSNNTLHYWRVRGKNDAGYGPYSQAWSFTTVVAAPAAATLLLPVNSAAGVSLSPEMSWSPLATAASCHLQVARDSLFTSKIFDDTTLTGTIQQLSNLTNNATYWWRVRGKNAGGYGPFSPTWSFTTIPVYPTSLAVSLNLTFAAKAKAADYSAADYRLIGLPGSSNLLANSIVTGVQNEDWEIVWDNGAASDYLKRYNGTSEFQFQVGRAFWIISRTPLTLVRTVPSATLNSTQEVEIPLRSGWNLITNPFDRSIPWSRIQASNSITGAIYSFNGAFIIATSLEPYAGYYFFNGSPSTVLSTLRVPYSSAFGKLTELEQKVESGWRMVVEVHPERGSEAPESRGETVEIGVEPDAKEGLDGYDQRMPRSLEKGSTYFDRPEWDNTFNEFGKDIKAESNQLKKWEFTIEGKLLEKKTIAVNGVKGIPQTEDVFLVDKERGVIVDLRQKQAYTAEMVKGKMRFEILVGRREMVDEETKKLIPTEIKVGPNYPNPFNPETIIPIELPKTTYVKVVVYDILGRIVKTLFDGTMESGRHYVGWKGVTDGNMRVSSGVYLLRVECDGVKKYSIRLLLIQ